MPLEEVTLGEAFKERGYRTAFLGKWHLGTKEGMRPRDQGFDDSLNMSGLLYLPEDHPDVVNAKRSEDNIERMVWASARYSATFNDSEPFQPDGYLTDYYTREALRVIENNRHRPFFLYLAHSMPHVPLFRSEDFEGTSLRGLYGDVIEEIERHGGIENLGRDLREIGERCLEIGAYHEVCSPRAALSTTCQSANRSSGTIFRPSSVFLRS